MSNIPPSLREIIIKNITHLPYNEYRIPFVCVDDLVKSIKISPITIRKKI